MYTFPCYFTSLHHKPLLQDGYDMYGGDGNSNYYDGNGGMNYKNSLHPYPVALIVLHSHLEPEV